ncbi:MAG: hybrid sensor histidine kinase/response regulator [Myxococcota bacterium]
MACIVTLAVDGLEGAPALVMAARVLEFLPLFVFIRLVTRHDAWWRFWLTAMLCWWGGFDALVNTWTLAPETAATSATLICIGAGFFPASPARAFVRLMLVSLATTCGLLLGGITTPIVLALPFAGTLVGLAFSQMQYRAEVQAYEAHLEALNALQAKGRFLARVSHEMRTPLHGILGILQSLDPKLIDHDRAAIDMALRSAQLLSTRINDVLSFADGETQQAPETQPQACDLHATLRDLPAIVSAPPGSIQLHVDADTLPQWAKTDGARIQQILLHLVENGLRFSEGAPVHVRATWSDALHLTIEDSGPGLPAALSSLIGAFEQGDEGSTRQYDGLGLGLALTSKLVEGLGGTLEAAARTPTGTCFTVVLPMETCSAPTPAKPEGVRGRVLVVDDNLINRKVLRRMVESLGPQVDEAVDGAQGLQMMRDEAYHLVLMDHHMPIMDGLEATRQAVSQGITTPIVAVTASAEPGLAQQSQGAGMVDHLTKPVDVRTMTQVLQRHLVMG